jgi:hypothetical protein
VRASFLPRGRQTRIRAQAQGLLDATANLKHVVPESEPPVDFELFGRCTVVVRARGMEKFVSRIHLKRVSASGSHTSTRPTKLEKRKSTAENEFESRYVVRAGRYRLVTAHELPLQEFDVRDAKTEVDLDLREAEEVEVRVHAPAPFNQPEGALIARLELDGQSWGLLFSGDQFLHPGDRAITVRAFSRVLREHPRLGATTVHRPGAVAHVHLVVGPRCRFRWQRPPPPRPAITNIKGAVFDANERNQSASSHPPRSMFVQLTAAGRAESDAQPATAMGSRWNFQFTTPSDGIFDLVIREPGRGVVLLRSVDLSGSVDLGTIQPESAHHVTVVARERRPSEWLRIGVEDPESGREIAGQLIHGKNNATVLRALPAGKWNLRFQINAKRWTQSIECADGKAQVVEVDCGNR